MIQKVRTLETAETVRPYFLAGDGVTSNPRPAGDATLLNQYTDTEGHPWHLLHKQKDRRVRDIGGAFHTRRYSFEPEYKTKRFTVNAYYAGGVKYVDGNIHGISAALANFNQLNSYCATVTDSVMDSWGTTAISQVIPTKSEVDLTVSAIELAREGLPKLIGQGLLKSVIKDHRKVGRHIQEGAGDYLNYEFGIKPLINDVQGISKSIVEAAVRLKQLERDSGRLVRRKFDFPIRREELRSTVTSFTPVGWSNTYLWRDFRANRQENYYNLETKRWFSGAFTYHLDLGERQRNQLYAAADNARLLLGVKLDAEVLWNLAPWSWLADWFGNVGDIMTNVSHFSRDRLVMPYGYLMCSQSATRRAITTLNWNDPAAPRQLVDYASFIRKQRRPAHPFGFGLSDMMLDTRQTAILSALGITRVPRK
jgi:hypothetical protein